MRKMSILILWLISHLSFASTLSDWPTFSGDAGGMQYTPLTQITADNVKNLKPVWTYRTGDVSNGENGLVNSAFEATPILFNNLLYFCTPFNRVIALDPETGKEIWNFDPKLDKKNVKVVFRCRGVSSWQNLINPKGFCSKRIFSIVEDGRIVALDADSGKLCKDFGEKGIVDLNKMKNFGVDKIQLSSPPAIYKNLLIIGSSIPDNVRMNMPHGIVRALDVKTGKEVWQFDPIPKALQNVTGAANVWAPISVDLERGIVYLPTSSPSPDVYGAFRKDPLPFTTALVALNANNGKPIWHYQIVHHNLWDYDLPAQPLLFTLQKDGKNIPAVAQGTKMGLLFIFNRVTGKPIFSIEERSVPQTDVPGEVTSPTQPIPTLPLALSRQYIKPDEAFGLTPIDQYMCKRAMQKLRNEGMYTPPTLAPKQSLLMPFAGGGMNWGHLAFDPSSGSMIVSTSNLIHVTGLFPASELDTYKKNNPSWEVYPQTGTPYGTFRHVLLSPIGLPCNPPPWGELSAVDVATGQIKWRIPFGSVKKNAFLYSFEHWGSPNVGGILTTGSGLFFISASMDNRFHAFDTGTGKEIWEVNLPAQGAAIPMSYLWKGKQYIVIAAGGGMGSPSNLRGDSLVAFALKNRE